MSSIMKIGGLTSQPIGHYEYCQRAARDCNIVSRATDPVKLTRARWAEMVEANARANSTITPVTDEEYYGVQEYWVMPKTAGDCEDFALMKRQRTDAQRLAGFIACWLPSSRQKNGDGHAVLTVRTDRADYVLDNLNGRILPWNETEYSFLKRQAAAHSGQWEKIIDTRTMVGASSNLASGSNAAKRHLYDGQDPKDRIDPVVSPPSPSQQPGLGAAGCLMQSAVSAFRLLKTGDQFRFPAAPWQTVWHWRHKNLLTPSVALLPLHPVAG